MTAGCTPILCQTDQRSHRARFRSYLPYRPLLRRTAGRFPRRPYCITDKLIAAVKGDVENGLLFCGAKAYMADKIETVHDVIADLFGTESECIRLS